MLESGLLVGIAAESSRESRMVEHQRDAEEVDPRRDRRLDRQGQLPDRFARRLHERASRSGASDRRRIARREQCSRATVNDGLGRRDDEDEVGVDHGRIDPRPGRDRHEIGSGCVVDDDLAAERARLGRRKKPLELLPPDPPREPTCDEEGDVLVRDAEALELVENGRERLRSRIALRSRQRERRRLDDDRDVSAAPRELGERRTREREGEGVSHRGGNVDNARGRWRWAQDHVVGADRDGDDPRARQERHATQSTEDDTVALCRRRP